MAGSVAIASGSVSVRLMGARLFRSLPCQFVLIGWFLSLVSGSVVGFMRSGLGGIWLLPARACCCPDRCRSIVQRPASVENVAVTVIGLPASLLIAGPSVTSRMGTRAGSMYFASSAYSGARCGARSANQVVSGTSGRANRPMTLAAVSLTAFSAAASHVTSGTP